MRNSYIDRYCERLEVVKPQSRSRPGFDWTLATGSWFGLCSRCAARFCARPRIGFLIVGSVCRIGKAIDDFAGPHQIELFACEFFQIRVVITNAVNALAQSFVFLL